MKEKTPTLYEWVGGIDRIESLFGAFYKKVAADAVLGPIFAHMSQDHFRVVTQFVAEVLGGDELNLPGDPEFRSALVGYLEWGSRLAVINSAAIENPIGTDTPMPQWGWGEVKGPYQPT
jgi:hemoglobin